MNNYLPKTSLYITGFGKDIDRKTLMSELVKFGKISKLYLEPSRKFANVFFEDRQCTEIAHSQINNSPLNWQASFKKNPLSNMTHYDNDYEEDFSENFDYCNIHGQPLVVLQADSGDLYVNLKDIRKTGFAVFRSDTFDSVLVDKRQIGKEFELHLLSEAKNYILKNRVACIDEEQILKTIERCKNKLLEGHAPQQSPGANRSVSHASKNITVTSTNEHPASKPNFTMPAQGSHNRPPKVLPSNFTPTLTQRGGKPTASSEDHQGSKGKRDNVTQNGAVGSNFSNFKKDTGLNSSSSSDKSGCTRKQGGFQADAKPQRNPKQEISKITFELGETYDVTVSYKEEKENICWVQDHRYAKELEEVIIQINDLANNLQPVDPYQGQLVAVEYEGMWNRGRVVKTDPPIIHFLDYGNKSGVDVVKPLPDSLSHIPALAARVVLSKKQDVTEDMTLKIRIKQKYEGGTYLVNVIDNEDGNRDAEMVAHKSNRPKTDVPVMDDTLSDNSPSDENVEKPKQKVYSNIPGPLTELHNNDKIMLVDTEGNKFLVRTKECALKSKTLTDYIKNLDKTNLTLTQVKVGQLVLCSKDGYAGLFRAVVCKWDNDVIVTVKYIDFPGEADLSVKSLRNVDEFLAKEPATLLMTPEYKHLDNLSPEAAEYISTLCQNKAKFTLVSSRDEFDLQTEDGSFLSQILEEYLIPSKPAKKESPKTSLSPQKPPAKTEQVVESKTPEKKDVVLYDEMDYIKIDPGAYTFMCYCLQDIHDITFLSSNDEVIEYLETITSATPSDEEPYQPEASEMCLVLYKGPDDDEATWYRSVVLSVEEDEYTVNFVDFGNLETAKSQNIRKFPDYLKNIPILGISCSCAGLPNKPEILQRLQELIPEGTQVEVSVKTLDGLKYQIELPEIYKQLKSENLF